MSIYISLVLGVIFCCYSAMSEDERVVRERNILNENVMSVNILTEKRELQKRRKS